MAIIKLAAGLGAALLFSSPLAAQTIGSVDRIDRDSVVGWACTQGNATSLVAVQLYLYNTTTGWTYLGQELANRERTDVGHSGLCGSGNEAFYHGFEYTIFPEQVIASQGTYQVYAFAGQQLPGSGGTVSFATAGFPTRNVWRTDYDDPNQRLVGMVSCIFPFKGANPIPGLNEHPDPRFLNAGATVHQSSWEDFPGQLSGPVWCLRNHRYDQASWYWPQSNSASNSNPWPTSDFWVISANNELAYSKTQSGPPSQSQPVNVGDLYSVSMEKSFITLGIDNDSPGYNPINDTPFLSLGAVMGRGVAGPIGFIEPSGQDTYLEFTVRQLAESPVDYHDIAVYVELMWGGYKRFLGVSLRQPTVGARFHWNWNALESFWFPGGEFNIMGSQVINDACSFGAPANLPSLGPATIGQTRQVSIPLRGLLQCLETRAIENFPHYGGGTLGWEISRPTQLPLAITGVHLAVEQGPGQPYATMQTRFTKPVLVKR